MSGIVGYSGSKSGIAGKGHIGQVVQIAHKTWASGDAYNWIGTSHTDWSWSRHSASLSFTNCGIGNKILLHGASSGYMGHNDYGIQWTWAVKDGANNEVNLGDLATGSGGMGGSDRLSSFYNHEGAEDYGMTTGCLGYYIVQPTSGSSIEFRQLLKTGGGSTQSNVWLEQLGMGIGYEISQ